MKRIIVVAVIILGLVGVLLGVRCATSSPLLPPVAEEDVARWATPIDLEGVPNFYKVTDSLYRSQQPTAEGMKNLEKMGIKTVINLRLFHSDEDELEGTNLKGLRIKVEAWDADEDEVIEFLKIVADPKNHPVLVHCKHGADRTGMMCAVYRMVVCGWDAEDAVTEMTRGPFGYHKIWKDIVAYLGRLNVDQLRKDAGIEDRLKSIKPPKVIRDNPLDFLPKIEAPRKKSE